MKTMIATPAGLLRIFCALACALAMPAAAGAAARGEATPAHGLPPAFYPVPGGAFNAIGSGYAVALSPSGLTLRLPGAGSALTMQPLDAAPMRLAPDGRLPGVVNLYAGLDPRDWRTGLPTFSRVRATGLWPGISAVFHGHSGTLEYDFRLAPGADPQRLALRFSGMRRMVLDTAGDLVLHLRGRSVIEPRPRAWQFVRGGRVAVAVRWLLRRHRVAVLSVGRYDSAAPLVVDPQLLYSTYVGNNAYVAGLAVGSDGGAYTVGNNSGTSYVQHLAPDGRSQVFTTVLADADGLAIAVDPAGDSYLAGRATPGFATTPGALVSSSALSAPGELATNAPFAAKLGPTGAIVASTLLTPVLGAGSGYASGIALDATGDAYVAVVVGDSESLAVTPGTEDPTPSGQVQQTGIQKLDLSATGSAQLVWGTYLDPYPAETLTGIAVDSSGEPVVVGNDDLEYSLGGGGGGNGPPRTRTQGSRLAAAAVSGGQQLAGFVAKLSSNGATLKFQKYVGSSLGDLRALTLDATGDTYVTGELAAQSDPGCDGGSQTSGAFCAFVSKVSPSGGPVWTYTLDGGSDVGRAIALDASGDVLIDGLTGSTTFPTTPGALQGATGGGQDAFLSELNPAGNALLYSTYLGGPGGDSANALGVDQNGNAILAGTTGGGFPTTPGAFDTTSAPGGFVASVNPVNVPLASTGTATSLTQTSATLNGVVDPRGANATWHFQYGTSTAYGSQTAPTVAFAAGPVGADISPLDPGVTYHFRLVATHDGIESDGADQTFTTQQPSYTGPAITQEPQNVTVVAGQTATFAAAATGTPYAARRWQQSTDGGVNFSQLDIADGTQCISTGAAPTTDTTALSTGADNSCPAGTNAYGGTGLGQPDSLADNGQQFEVSFETPDGQTVTGDPATLTVIAAPSVLTEPASFESATTATLGGTVNPNGADTSYHFDYGTTTAYGAGTTSTDAGAGRATVAVNAGISGLEPNTTYHFRLVATNSVSGPPFGGDQTFTTPPPPAAPGVSLGAPSSLTPTSATVGGAVNPSNEQTTYAFEYGTSPGYGRITNSVQLPAGDGPIAVSTPLGGLAPATVYHYALVAENLTGKTVSADGTFTTAGTGGGGGSGSGTQPPAGSLAHVAIASVLAKVVHGRAAVKLYCAGAAGSSCGGTLTLTRRTCRAHGRCGPGSTTVGSARFSIDAGGRVTVQVRLTRAGARLLAGARHYRLAVSAYAAAGSGTPRQALGDVTLYQAPKRRHRQ